MQVLKMAMFWNNFSPYDVMSWSFLAKILNSSLFIMANMHSCSPRDTSCILGRSSSASDFKLRNMCLISIMLNLARFQSIEIILCLCTTWHRAVPRHHVASRGASALHSVAGFFCTTWHRVSLYAVASRGRSFCTWRRAVSLRHEQMLR